MPQPPTYLSVDREPPQSKAGRNITSVIEMREKYPKRSLLNLPFGLRCFPGFKKDGHASKKTWTPVGLGAPLLLVAAIIPIALIVVLQLLLTRSQSNGGIIFDKNINDLPLSRSFSYLYLPTIIAVIYSIIWSWIDLDVKRLEPYNRLYRPEGTTGKLSLVLSYPIDFIASVPFVAIRNGHWPVVWSSLAVVFVFWGITPFQAGIFATDTITRQATHAMVRSVVADNSNQGEIKMDTAFMYSVFGLTWLNETLPGYMNKEYALAPFWLHDNVSTEASETWTAPTMRYGLDVICEEGFVNTAKNEFHTRTLYSSNGCKVPLPYGPDGTQNATVREGGFVNEYTPFYVGFDSGDAGLASYYLSSYCPDTANNTFLATYAKNKLTPESPQVNATMLFCHAEYYQQPVEVTISLPGKSILNLTETSVKEPFNHAVLNVSSLEKSMNMNQQWQPERNGIPGVVWPDQMEQVSTMNVTLLYASAPLSTMAGLSIGLTRFPLNKYLEPEILQQSYQAAYRLVFARAIAARFAADAIKNETVSGSREFAIGAVILVPAFTYLVEALLGCVSLLSLALLYISIRRKSPLKSDPGTIAALMALTGRDRNLRTTFKDLDYAKMREIEEDIQDLQFKIEHDGQSYSLVQIMSGDGTVRRITSPMQKLSPLDSIMKKQSTKAVRPTETRSFTITVLVLIQVATIVTLAVLWVKSQPHSIPLPSSSRFVRQLLENYLPTAIATFIEPIWIVITRLLCMLQPFEELRGGNAKAEKSLTLTYTSIPPQLSIFQALRSGHLLLASTCIIVFLANVLAIAFNGLFSEASVLVPYSATFTPTLQAKFISINGSDGPSTRAAEAWVSARGKGYDQFNILVSNATAGTPLPPWTDYKAMFQPFTPSENNSVKGENIIPTVAFGTSVEWRPAIEGLNLTVDNVVVDGKQNDAYNFTVAWDGKECRVVGAQFSGTMTRPDQMPICTKIRNALEMVFLLDGVKVQDQAFCEEMFLVGWWRYPKPRYCLDYPEQKTPQLNRSLLQTAFVAFRPSLTVGSTKVAVDERGYVQRKNQSIFSPTDTPTSEHLSNEPSNLIRQANRFLLRNRFWGEAFGLEWHNDTLSSDWLHYVIQKYGNSESHAALTAPDNSPSATETVTRRPEILLDPNLPVPRAEDAAALVIDAYQRLFAVWLGHNKNRLFLPTTPGEGTSVQGTIERNELRVVMSRPMFIISEIILSMFTIAAIVIYFRSKSRNRFLPRLPTSIGSIIAMFAAGSLPMYLKDTNEMDARERKAFLQTMDNRYGYGSFLGTDGRIHIGIERAPFVRPVPIGAGNQRKGGWQFWK